MRKINTIELARWILLGPVVFICSGITFGLGVFFFDEVIGLTLYQNGALVVGIASAVTVFVWLFLTYLIAPKFKKKTTWISYILGSLLIILISALITGESSSKNQEVVSLLVSSLTTGLIFSLVVQFKSATKMKSLVDIINENITSSN